MPELKRLLAGQITFVANPKYAAAAKTTAASAVIVSEDFPAIATGMLRSKNPYLTFARAIDLFYQSPRYDPAVHPTAVIAPTAKVGKNAHIAAYVVIDDDVEIGDDAVLLPHVVIYRGARIGNKFFAHAHAVVREYCRLGDNVILQNGVIVGSDGFGFARDGDHWEKITQSGPAVLEDDVEVQANSCIDRASVGETRIARGVKVDNLVQVGHGSAVGEHTLALRAGGARRLDRSRQERHPGRTGRRRRALQYRRRRHRDCAKRHPRRYSRRVHGQRLAGFRSQRMVARRRLSSINSQNLQKRCEALMANRPSNAGPTRKKNRRHPRPIRPGTIAQKSSCKSCYLSSQSCF